MLGRFAPILVLSRTGASRIPGTLEQATDVDRVGFVEDQRAPAR